MAREKKRSHPAAGFQYPTAAPIQNAGQYAGSVAFADLTGKPTTIAGYGITNAYTKTEVDTLIAAAGGALSGLSDVDLTGLADGDVLAYDLASGFWLPVPMGGGGGSIDGGGTGGMIAKWSDANTLTDSLFSDDGTTASVSGILEAQAGVLIAGGSFSAGLLYKSATLGLVIAGAAGSVMDLLLTSSTGSSLLSANNGTTELDVWGDLKPGTDASWNLGSASKQFVDLYLSGDIYIGGTPLATGGGASPSGHHAGTTTLTVRYAAACAVTATLGTFGLSAVSNRVYYVPFVAPARGGTIDELSINVTTAVAASTCNLGIYDTVSATDITPNTLLANGNVSSATTGIKTLSVSQALTPGRIYYLAVQASVAGIAVSSIPTNFIAPYLAYTATGSARVMLFHTNGSFALPATAAAPSDLTGSVPALFYRFSA